MSNQLRLLQVEDSESDALIIIRQLTRGGYSVSAKRVEDAKEMRAALSESDWELIICDHRLPCFDAPGALAVLQESGRDIPFLVVSGTIGEEVAVEMMRAGAHDYLMKGNLTRLAATVERELREAATRAQRKQALKSLQASEAQLTLAIEATELGVFDYDPRTGQIFYSDVAKRHLQVPMDEASSLERFLSSLHEEDRTRVEQSVKRALSFGGSGRYAEEYRTNQPVDGEDRWIAAWGKVFHDENGQPIRFLGVVSDITRRKRSELELKFQFQLNAAITQQSTDCILLTGPDETINFANAEAQRVFGFSLQEFTGRTPHELLHHRYPDGMPYPASECAAFGSMHNGTILRDHEDLLFHRNGTPIEASISCVPLVLNGDRIGTLFTLRDITERKRTERALRQSDERFRRLFEADIIGILVTDGQDVLECNDHFLQMLGYSREEFFAGQSGWRSISASSPTGGSSPGGPHPNESGVCPAVEQEYVRKGGAMLPVLFAGVELAESPDRRILAFVLDLTEQKNLESQFRQAQKLESIGLLAGGVAHDFNNLLTVIMGYARMLLATAGPDSPLLDPLANILSAAGSAAVLTRQLLTFSRRNIGEPKPIALDFLVKGIREMLQRLIGEHIEVSIRVNSNDAFINADPVLIEQVIVNLALNSRDAMPEGGILYIETSRILVADEFASLCLSIPQGDYVSLSVTDTGVGMTPEVQARLYEPFFTTKEPGKGTGLGLPTVYGIVKQSGGSISVHSAPGLGTTFRILFPAVQETAAVEVLSIPTGSLHGNETVLLVEDQEGVRHYVRDALESYGYKVIDTGTGEEALARTREYAAPIHILLTDVVLPGMNGAQISREFLKLRPGVPVLRMSGYPERFGVLAKDNIPHLQKPFTAEVLMRRIRDILDSRSDLSKVAAPFLT